MNPRKSTWPHTRAGLQAGLDKVTKADGSSPFSDAIDGANQDLRETSGKTALIIVTDGEDLGNGPIEAAMRLKKQYGSRVCIYTIAVGSNIAGKEYLNKLAQQVNVVMPPRPIKYPRKPVCQDLCRMFF